MKKDQDEEKVQQARDLLKEVVKRLGPTRQELERQLGLSSGYMSKILNGEVELRLRHIHMILEGCGVEAWKFFAAASPRPGSEEAALAELLTTDAGLAEAAPPLPPTALAVLSDLSRSLIRLTELVERGADLDQALRRGAQEPASEPGSARPGGPPEVPVEASASEALRRP